MWNRIKKFGYLMLGKYVFVGAMLGVFVFQFVTISIANHRLAFDSLIDGKTITLVVSILVGSVAGGLVQLLMLPNDKISEQNDYKFWTRLQEKGNLSFLFLCALGMSFGGLVGMLTKKMLSLDIDNFFQMLFSNESITDYLGMAFAAFVFGLLFALGTIKRLKHIYGN